MDGLENDRTLLQEELQDANKRKLQAEADAASARALLSQEKERSKILSDRLRLLEREREDIMTTWTQVQRETR